MFPRMRMTLPTTISLCIAIHSGLLAADSPLSRNSGSRETTVSKADAVPEPPARVEGFDRARWYYDRLTRSASEAEIKRRALAAEADLWRRLDKLLQSTPPAEMPRKEPTATKPARENIPAVIPPAPAAPETTTNEAADPLPR